MYSSFAAMPKLRTISDNTLNALPPAALHKLGCLFTAKSENFTLPKHPELETCELNGKRMPTSRELRDLYNEYKKEFLNQMDKLSALSPGDIDVLLLAHYLHLGKHSDDYVDRLEQTARHIPRKALSGEEYVVSVMLSEDGDRYLSRASLMFAASRTCGYQYFVPDLSALQFSHRVRVRPGEDFDRLFADTIREEIKKRYGTGICRVYSEEKGDLWVIEVTHGGIRRKESNESNSETIDALRQPIEVDCIIYDKKYNDVRIHMENANSKIMELYYSSLGYCMYNNPRYWHEAVKYQLEHFNIPKTELQQLLIRGSERLSNPRVGKLAIKVTKVSYSVVREDKHRVRSTDSYTRSNSAGLNNTMGEDETLVPAYAHIKSVTLRLTYGLKNKGISILLTQKKRTLETEAIPGIEDWLHDEGFFYARKPNFAWQEEEEQDLEAAEEES